MKPKRIVFVAYEPWETRVASRFLNQLTIATPDIHTLLLVADPYQIRNTRSAKRIKSLDEASAHSTEIVFRDIRLWQHDISTAKTGTGAQELRSLGRDLSIDYLDTILHSDPHLYPRERSPFYGPMTIDQTKKAASLVIRRTADILDAFQPDAIVMMWDQYLVKNLVGAYALERNIPIRVFRRLRFQDFLKLDYFFLSEGAPNSSLPARTQGSQLRRADIQAYGESLYGDNLAVSENSFIQLCKSDRPQATARTLSLGWARQMKKLRAGVLSRPRHYRFLRYWSSHQWRVHVYLGLKVLRTLRYIWRNPFLTSAPDLPDRFIAIPLHFRPESAILTQGFGIEDDDVVRQVAQHLKDIDQSVSCVVLEHPSMVEDRRTKFYKSLLALPNVVFADPSVNTQWLIRRALGVVTVSGTVGLEASIADVPVHVMGKPEFLEAIRSHGVDSLRSFLKGCADGNITSSQDSVLNYLVTYADDSRRGEMGWSTIQSEERLKQTTSTLVEMFRSSFSDGV